MSPLVVISGTTHGIGRVTSLELARAGFSVIMLCRDRAAAARVRDAIVAEVPGAAIQVIHCDLASLASVRECASQVRRDFGHIDVLINNAGMVSTRRRLSADGFELTFATNHLGPFLLTELLRDLLPAGGRIINVASRVHYKGRLDLKRVTDPRAPYNSIKAYAQSKLANVMHGFALARRLSGSGVSVNCLHPGVVATNLLPPWLRVIKPFITRVMFDEERGARTTLFLAQSSAVAGVSGKYFDENQRPQPASALANDTELQEALWQASERWTLRN